MDRRQSFLVCLAQLEQWLASQQIPYAVFGSVAAAAWTDLGASLDFDRPGAHHPSERIPDIDLIVSRASLNRVKGYARAARRGEFPISIDTFWSECWIDFRPGSPFSYLIGREESCRSAGGSCGPVRGVRDVSSAWSMTPYRPA